MSARAPRNESLILSRIQVDASTGCWNWTGATGAGGRPIYNAEYAYRISYEVFVEPLAGRQVNHHCDNPMCVNPDHIYAGTQGQNMQDAVDRGRLRIPVAPRGQNQHTAHPDAVVAEVRRAVAAGELTKREAAERFGVGVGTIRQWLRGSRVDDEPISVRDERLRPRPACGTRAGYCRHKKYGEPRCEPCWEANRQYMSAYKARAAQAALGRAA